MTMRLFWSLILLTLLNSAAVYGQYAEFSFSDRVHKFPHTQEGEVLEHNFSFVNTGDQPLIISNFKVSCSCTKVSYPNRPIMPGDTASVQVRFDTEGKIGWQYRPIQLFANTKKSPSEIEIRVKVIPKE